MLNPEQVKFTYFNKTISELLNIDELTYEPIIKLETASKNQPIIIESLLLRIPIDLNFLCSFTNNELVIYTNQYKLNTIINYVKNEFSLYMLDYFKQYKDFYYDDLPGMVQRRISGTKLRLIHIDQQTPHNVRDNIISRIEQP